MDPRRTEATCVALLISFAVGGPDGLRQHLAGLGVEEPKDTVAEHGMDRTKLAMKWKTSGRLVDVIVETASARAKKGGAFREG